MRVGGITLAHQAILVEQSTAAFVDAEKPQAHGVRVRGDRSGLAILIAHADATSAQTLRDEVQGLIAWVRYERAPTDPA